MGVSWSSPRSLRPVSPRVARDQPFRRLVRGFASLMWGRRGPALSPLADALSALSELPQVAGDGSLTSQGVPVAVTSVDVGAPSSPTRSSFAAVRGGAPMLHKGRRYLL